jgi:hypothetical protein
MSALSRIAVIGAERFAAASTNDRFCRCTAARPEGFGV